MLRARRSAYELADLLALLVGEPALRSSAFSIGRLRAKIFYASGLASEISAMRALLLVHRTRCGL